jgi:hypothetical protein
MMTTRAEVLETLPYRCVSLCLAALDEPVFILRAQDILAPRVVVRWAHLRRGREPATQSAKCLSNRQANGRLASEERAPHQGAGLITSLMLNARRIRPARYIISRCLPE